MKWSFASVALIVLGLTGLAVIMLFQQITTNNENDYYLLKEVTEAAMIDAIDISYYRETGNLKIITEKFVENFTRRFAESTIFVTNDYKISFYDIMETPPKVSVVIDTGIGEYTIHGNSEEYNIVNKLDAILEYTGKYTNVDVNDTYYNKPYVLKTQESNYYAILSTSGVKDFSLKTPDKLIGPNIKNIQIEKVVYDGVVISQEEVNMALLKNELSYNGAVMDTENYMQSIDDFSTNINNISMTFYNCDSRTGDIKNTYNCSDINKYYVSINGDISDKVIVKYKITWSYEEYEL